MIAKASDVTDDGKIDSFTFISDSRMCKNVNDDKLIITPAHTKKRKGYPMRDVRRYLYKPTFALNLTISCNEFISFITAIDSRGE
jgi:hypothetical protein